MTKRIPVDELTRLAFVHAEVEIESLIDAYGRTSDESAYYKKLLNQLGSYRKKRWGKTEFESRIENSPLVDAMTLMSPESASEGAKP